MGLGLGWRNRTGTRNTFELGIKEDNNGGHFCVCLVKITKVFNNYVVTDTLRIGNTLDPPSK